MTLLAAPWLLREGRHIRVDILLRALPQRAAYACEWIADALGFACCLWLVFYGASAAKKSWAGDALSIKTLVMPEWWFLAPLPICFLLLAIEFVFRMRRLKRRRDRPARRRGERGMRNELERLGRGVAAARRLDRAALPRPAGRVLVPRRQHRRRLALARRRARLRAARAQQRQLGDELFADADPAVRADGRDPVPHRPGGEGDRRHRAADRPGAGAARGGGGRRRHRVLGDLRLDHRHHRDARLADGAGDALARLPPDAGDRPGDGDRRRRHADPALGADGAARLALRHLDLEAADRRRRARPAARRSPSSPGSSSGCGSRRAWRRTSRWCATRLRPLQAVPALRAAAGLDLRRGRRRDGRGLGHAHRIGRGRRAGDDRPRARLPGADAGRSCSPR